MTLDRDRYTREVLDPARRANHTPPPDLFARYALDARSGAAEFDARVREVVAYWRELVHKRTYARLAQALLAAHTELDRAGELNVATFQQLRRAAHEEALGELRELVDAQAQSVTHLGAAAVTRLREAVTGPLDDADVRTELTRRDVRVVSLPVLPERPATGRLEDLAAELKTLGLRLSAEVVFGAGAVRAGFSLRSGLRLADGRQLTVEAIDAARTRLQKEAYDQRKTAGESVLASLRTAARRPGGLDALVTWEALEKIRPLAEKKFAQRALTRHLATFGLADEDEAGALAAAFLEVDAGQPSDRDVEEALRDGRLRLAERLVAGLPVDHPVRGGVVERVTAVADLVSRADRERSAGRTEPAAELLAEAARSAGDDDAIAERLDGIAPPPVPAARVSVESGRAVVTWDPSPVRGGEVRYRVVRRVGRAARSPGEGTQVAETTATEAVDEEPPVGTDVFYSVFAVRGVHAWSPPGAADAVVLLPDVRDLVLEADARTVRGSWTVHPDTVQVTVLRGVGRPPDGARDGHVVPGEHTRFTDTGLRAGTTYYYRVQAGYLTPDGRSRPAVGVVRAVTPSSPPEPVTGLRIAVTPGQRAAVAASWPAPATGEVTVRLGTTPPGWPAGTRISTTDLPHLGAVVSGTRRDAGDRTVLEFTPPSGRHYLTAVTQAGQQIVLGEHAELSIAEPVSELAARRFHDTLRLSWTWPDKVTAADVRWRYADATGDTADAAERTGRCTRRAYVDNGGYELDTGTGSVVITVESVLVHGGREYHGLPAETTVPAGGVPVHYRVRRAGRLRTGRARLVTLTCDQRCELPPLVVVQSTGRIQPFTAEQGEILARVPRQPIGPDQPVEIEVTPHRTGTWLGCFPAPGAATGTVTLRPPPTRELRIR